MYAFDEDCQKMLSALTQARAVLHFPFFANTFSLPYHYANMLAKGSPNRRNAKKHLVENIWGKDPHLVGNRTNIFYSTKASREDLQRTHARRWNIHERGFTHYRAKYIFVEPRLAFQRFQTFGPDFVQAINDQGVSHIEFLTDIPKQAKTVIQKLRVEWKFEGTIDDLSEPVDTLFFVTPTAKTLRLYFNGAPTTTHMRSHPAKYLPLIVPDEIFTYDDQSLTEICVATPKSDGLPEASCQTLLSDLAEYHCRIFDVAVSDPIKLVSVWWAYNQYAERTQRSATFPDPESFATCLKEHHQPVKQ